MTALVVDDSRAMRAIMGRILKQLGFEVVEAGNGREALDCIAQHGLPNVAMVDWNMPVMSGLDFVQAVRADPANADLRLVMVTTETELAQVGTALNAGVNEYVMKPFTLEVIREKLGLIGVATA